MGMWVSFFFAHDFRWFAAACGRFSVDGRCFMVEPMPADHSRRARGGNRAQLWAVKIWSMSHSLTVCVCVYIYILCIHAYIVVYILYIIDNNIIYAYHIYIYTYIYMHIIYIIILKSVEFMPPAFSNWTPEPAFRPSANPIGRTGHLKSTKTSKNNGFHKWVWINIILIGINKYWSIPTYYYCCIIYLLVNGGSHYSSTNYF